MFFCMLMLSGVLALAQTHTVSGTVRDEAGAPIPFATITESGTRNATNADGNGNFTIKMKGNGTLSVTATGFNGTSATPAGNTVAVALTRNAAELTTVVITTALGQQRQAKELGYAVTTVTNKTLTQAKSVGVAQALNGKVSGLNISTVNSGVFEEAKINIRGIRSLTGNNQPMLVIDGAPTPLGYLASIPPDDVQDLTVLKSAASAAIYGPDAVNGVIIVTTKRGGRRPSVTFNSTVEATKISFFPKLQKTFGAGAGEVVDQYGNFGYVPYENQQYGPIFDGSIKEIGVPLEDGTVQTGPYDNKHYQDKIKFWNTGITLQNSVSIAGEDFYVSIQDAKIKGLVPDDENRRTSFRFNGGKKYGKFAINYGLNYILQNSSVVNENGFQTTFSGAYDGGLFFLVLQTPSNVPLLDYKDQNSKYGNFSNYYNEYAVSPYWLIKNIRTRARQDDIIGNIDVNYQLFPWLKATARVSSNLSFTNSKNTNAPVIVSDWAKSVGFYGNARNSTQYSDRAGIVSDDEGYASRINLDYFLSGDHKIAGDFSVKYLAGGSVRQNRSKDVQVGGNNLVVPFLYNVAVRSGDANVALFNGNANSNNYEIESRLLSAYGTIGFSYKGWANVEFTGRNDWDSRLLEQNRSFFYPAANASIVLSDAINSLKNSSVFSYVKIRGAISKSGNVNLNPYSLGATYSQPFGFPYGTTAGFTANNTIPSINLKPEFVNTKEVGLELGFLKNRLNFEATYFYQNNTDQILQITQSATTGYTTGLANAADFKNYGVEMDLGLTPLIRLGKGRLDLKVNATYNNNEVTRTLGDVSVVVGGSNFFIQNSVSSPTINNIAVVGSPAFAFELTDYQRDSLTGKVIVDRVTGLPSQADGLVIKGRSLPLWVVGATPSFSIGDFSVSMTWDYKGGHNFFSGLGSDADFAGISARSAEYGRQRFVFPNSVIETSPGSGKYEPNTNIQVQDGGASFWTSAKANSAVATNYFASANALRLREVNISYSLPTRLFGNSKVIKRITISAVAKNLFLFVPKSNQWGDPEFNYSATGNTFGLGSSFQSPASRLFGGSVVVQF